MAVKGFSWVGNIRKKINNNLLTRKMPVLKKPLFRVFSKPEIIELKRKINKNHAVIESKGKILVDFAEKLKKENESACFSISSLYTGLRKSQFSETIHSLEKLGESGRKKNQIEVLSEFFNSFSSKKFFPEIKMTAEDALKIIQNYKTANQNFIDFKTWRAERTRTPVGETPIVNPELFDKLKKFVPETILSEIREYERAQRFSHAAELRLANPKKKETKKPKKRTR
ncbi:MAG: hypothetical protein JW703_03200 [Candidatus Diapherotrites archaeon]|nr:hypothetical protein [Candidatus Diapherotrites archaeon]